GGSVRSSGTSGQGRRWWALQRRLRVLYPAGTGDSRAQGRLAQTAPAGRRSSRSRAHCCGGYVSKSRAFMAESTSVALAAASIPSSADISRAEKLVRERFVHDGEDPAVALAPRSARRRALDAALAELDANAKAKQPSTAWRREFALLLGLERLLSEEEPKLADGTVLS